MNALQTDSRLLAKLKESAGAPMTADEIHRQRVSYVMGTLNADSTLTREKVEALLLAKEGKGTAA